MRVKTTLLPILMVIALLSCQAVILQITLFIIDMNYTNFINMYAAAVYPLIEPYLAAFSVGPAMQQFTMNRKDLELIGYGFDEIYIFMMDVAYLSFVNTIDVFGGNNLPLPIDFNEDAWPSDTH